MTESKEKKVKTVGFRGTLEYRLMLRKAAIDLGYEGNVQKMLEEAVARFLMAKASGPRSVNRTVDPQLRAIVTAAERTKHRKKGQLRPSVLTPEKRGEAS